LPESKLKEIANRMRHTIGVARGAYKKINIIPEDVLEASEEKFEPKALEVSEKPVVKLPIVKERKEKYFNAADYSKNR